jgi:hypothetical protein
VSQQVTHDDSDVHLQRAVVAVQITRLFQFAVLGRNTFWSLQFSQAQRKHAAINPSKNLCLY